MRMNYNCLRKVLLFIEEKLTFERTETGFKRRMIGIDEIYNSDDCSGYSENDVLNCITYLNDEEMITASFLYGDGAIQEGIISNITSKGQEFLDKIRSDSFWNKLTKHIENTEVSIGLGSFFQFTMNFK